MEFGGYHATGLSPHAYSNASPVDSPGRLPADQSPAFGRAGSGPATPASGGFTATLPPLHEQPSNEAVPTANGSHPAHTAYGQLVGDDGEVGMAAAGAGGTDLYGSASSSSSSRQSQALPRGRFSSNPSPLTNGTLSAGTSMGGDFEFRDPFARSTQAGTPSGGDLGLQSGFSGVFGFNPPPLDQSAAMASSSQHTYFNPQTVHPSVNTRNTRPMTAPSGSGYFPGHHYSSAPSAFYVPPTTHQQLQHRHQPASTTFNPVPIAALDPAPPGSSQGIFAFQPDMSASQTDYSSSRERGFGAPDPLTASMSGDRPVTADPDILSSSNPFMYQPPLLSSTMSGVRPYTAVTPGYYTALVDPFTGGALPAPLQMLPPGSADGFAPSIEPQSERRRSSSSSAKYNFVTQPPQHTKRPRRRYDEIERMYNCDYPGCTKSYGTLNHLNSHKTMQKHGPKATPAQFKEMRKAWRERKKAEAAEAARAKAKEPFQATPVPYPPSVLPTAIAPLYSSHPAVPQTQTSLGMAQPLVLPQAIPDPRSQTALLFDMHLATAAGDGYVDASSRPVTAPAHQHAPPPFGGLAADQQQQSSHGLDQASLSATSNGFARSRTLVSDPLHHERRFSLPGSYMLPTANGGYQHHQHEPVSESMPPPQSSSRSAAAGSGGVGPASRQPATPEMKMPQPVHAPSSYATLIGGGVGDGASTKPAGESASSTRSPRVNEVAA
ncbi:hypothetical protein JCM3774_002403 [Rhodotorula dairenensis]